MNMTCPNNILGKEKAWDSSTGKCVDPEVINIASIHILLARIAHMVMQRIRIIHISEIKDKRYWWIVMLIQIRVPVITITCL